MPEGSSARQAMFIIAKEASRMDNEATNHSFYIPMRHRGTISMGSIGLAENVILALMLGCEIFFAKGVNI